MPGLPTRNTRVLAAIALLAVGSLGLGGLVYVITDRESAGIDAANDRLDLLRQSATTMADELASQEAAVDDFVLSGDPAASARYEEATRLEAAALAAIGVASSSTSPIDEAMTDLAAVGNDWRTDVANPAIAAKQAHDQAGLDRFAALAATDHRDVELAEKRVVQALEAADTALTAQRSAAVGVQVAAALAGFLGVIAAFGIALIVVRRFGQALELDASQAGILNRFTEVTSFAAEDRQVAEANLSALARLVRPDASVTHVLNRSLDRAVPEATTGDAAADVLPMHDLGRCAGILRGTMYVSDDLSDDLSVHCPVYPAASGTLACIPLASGEPVGAVHLYWKHPDALPLNLRPAVARITEHAALAIGNRRLLAALHGQANTDPRTGLANNRAFDRAVEELLASSAGREPTSILMLDIDQFKLFNDRHGHPGGDEALRSFADVLRSCMRDGDIAARYGGEEFAVVLPGVDRAGALSIAERVRARTESAIISLAPGLTDRITVSIGVATAPDDSLERVALLRLADEALYRAKELGRNRVETLAGPSSPTPLQGAPAFAEAGTAAAVADAPKRTRRRA